MKQISLQTDLILNVVEQAPLEKLANYEDRWPLLILRKTIKRTMLNIKNFCKAIITTKAFERASIMVILFNSMTLAMEDPQAVSTTEFADLLENLFLTLYTIEMILKIIGLGFMFSGPESYMRDYWNLLDFTIVVSSYFTVAQDVMSMAQNGGQKKLQTAESSGQEGFSLNSLRSFRVLRPLKAITSIKGLQTLVAAVVKSLPLLQDTIIVLMAFFVVFAIAGTQLLMGELKNRCVRIEDGTNFDDEYICGARNQCPEGYFCGKQNSNPNYGVTNFDNLMFALLVVFQCITLEGWSDIMVQYQQSYSNYAFIMFLPIVFIGAFFLVNLTLAVINASFGEEKKKQLQRLEIEKAKAKAMRKKDLTQIDLSEPIEQIGVRQFWIAQRAARKLIQNLRDRQARIKTQSKLDDQIIDEIAEAELKKLENKQKGPNQKKLDESAEEDFSVQIYNFLEETPTDDYDDKKPPARKDQNKEVPKYAISEMRVADRLTKLFFGQSKSQIQPIKTTDGAQLAVKEPELTSKQIQGAIADPKTIEDILDATNLLHEADRSDLTQSSFMHPFDLSQNHSAPIDYEQDSEESLPHNAKPDKVQKDPQDREKDRKPWQDSDALSSVIISDSSFEQNLEQLDIYRDEKQLVKLVDEKYSQKKPQTTVQAQETLQVNKKQDIASKVETPPLPLEVLEEMPDVVEEVTRKGKKKKKKKSGKRKNGATGPDAKYRLFKQTISEIDEQFAGQEPSKNPFDYINKKSHKIEILADMPYNSSSQNDVFQIRNELADKMALQDINPYVMAANQNNEEGGYVSVQAPLVPTFWERLLNKVPQTRPEPPKPKAFQQKIRYRVQHEEPVEFDDDDDDALILALQPFDTVMSIGYGHLLSHRPIKFVTRRSDIIVSSTLQLTLVPSDSGYRPLDHALMSFEQIQNWVTARHTFRAKSVTTATFYKEETINEQALRLGKTIRTVNDESSLTMQRSPTIKTIEESIQGSVEYKRNGTTSHDQSNSKNNSKSLGMSMSVLPPLLTKSGRPTRQVEHSVMLQIPPTLQTKPIPPEKLNLYAEEERRLYNIQKGKYDTYMRICQKKEQQGEHPRDRKFTLADVQALMIGAHHEDDEDDDLIETNEVAMNYLGREDTFKKQTIEQFEQQARKILKRKNKKEKPPQKYIPDDLKLEFEIPDDIGQDTVNFDEIVKMDQSRARNTPMWSGQDVLQTGITPNLSLFVIDQINAVRVWPKDVAGPIKKARVFLKYIVKHSLFDNAMTFCVLLNTIVMGMDHYGIDEKQFNDLEYAGTIFTYIFIGEMTSKLVAIGPSKYFGDKMNWLDFTVVSTSLIEILMMAAGGGGGNLSAFKTLRVLRTFRVLRVARLLRALKSMQMIIAVIMRSAESFFYITLLMFVFIFIYTLLGMQIFGGQFNFDDGVPRGNYDTFMIAFLTVFQVLTTENWNSVLYDSMRSEQVGQFVPVAFYVSWIFIGNFILLNLFLAILLESFLSEDDEEDGDLEEIARIEAEKRALRIQKEKARRLKKMGASIAVLNEKVKNEKKASEDSGYIDDIDDLDEMAIKEIFMDVGLIKQKDKAREEKMMYDGIKCEVAQYLFTKKNWFRTACYKLMKHKLFDNVIMLLIGLSSVKLALDSYLVYLDQESTEVKLSDQIDIALNICFLIECIVKQIAMGTVMEQGSYLRESWNVLDAFIVFTSVLDMSLSGVDVPVIKILRLLRTLRPLRVISHNSAMKFILASLFNSMSALFNVMIVLQAVWLMFAIFAINIFAGKFFYCSIGSSTYRTKYECNVAGGSWLRAEQNFDDIFQAMLTLFNVASLEGWPDVMLYALDATEVDMGPKKEASVLNGFFFIIFILIGSFFLMNFFVGILFLKYGQAAKRDKQGYTEENLTWLAIQRMVIEQRCPHDLMNKPDRIKHPQKFKYWKIVTSFYFEVFIMAVIVLNIVQMGINFENAPTIYVFLLDISDYFFTVIFIGEAYLKMRAYSFRYFDTLSNKFDFFIVCSSIADIIMSFTAQQASEQFSLGPQIARMLRVLRVTRVVRIASKNEGLKALMQTITLSVSSLANVFLLLMLALFIFSILAVFFFSDLKSGNVISDFRNFNDFGQSFLLLFIITTGENWNMLMYDCNKTPPGCVENEDCGTSFAPAFFICFVLFIQNVMLNLFILIIIDQFDRFYISVDNPITKFGRNRDKFLLLWVEFTATKSRCLRLREKKLYEFFRRLPTPIGLPPETDDAQIKKIMLKMGIKCDDGYIYFNELLYRCMRRLYGNFKLNRKMQIEELKTQYKIYTLKLNAQSLYRASDPQKIFFEKTVGNGKSVNPFLQEMYYHISFNTWLNFSRKAQKRERFNQKQQIKRLKCEAEGTVYVPDILQEPKQKVKYVLIEVETEFIVTTDDNQSSSEEEIPEPPKKQLTLSELKKKKTIKPQIGISSNLSKSQPFRSKNQYKRAMTKDKRKTNQHFVVTAGNPKVLKRGISSKVEEADEEPSLSEMTERAQSADEQQEVMDSARDKKDTDSLLQ